MSTQIYRFAPTPNGPLHLGHALSALIDHDMARAAGGRFLVRMEDIDTTRCRPEHERSILDDLAWLGLSWDDPVRRQSAHMKSYRDALAVMRCRGLVYPAFATRGDVRAFVADRPFWPRDPEGTPHYPGFERMMTTEERTRRLAAGQPHAWRLDMSAALATLSPAETLAWTETGAGPAGETGNVAARPERWGDVVLARKETPTSYHLAVVVDDALQGVTHVVRGLDLFNATGLHRLLQRLLDLPEPLYHHHRLVLGPDGRKLSKSIGSTSLASLRDDGATAADVRRMVGL